MKAFRRRLVRLVRALITRPAALVGALLGMVILGVGLYVGAGAVRGGGVPALSLALPGSVASLSAPDAYLRGNREYDADLVWSSFSDDVRSQIQLRGGSADDIQRQMQAARERGYRLEEVSYIGGKSLPDGTSMQFYLVGVRKQARADLEYVPYLFTLDRGGKIARVQ